MAEGDWQLSGAPTMPLDQGGAVGHQEAWAMHSCPATWPWEALAPCTEVALLPMPDNSPTGRLIPHKALADSRS